MGDLDAWTFQAATGDRVTLNLSWLSLQTFSPRGRIYDAGGSLVGYVNNPDAGNNSQATLALIVPAGGIYSVVVDSIFRGGAGTYRLNYVLEAGPFSYPGATGTALTNGGNRDESILANEEDRWTFSADAGDRVLLRVGQLTGTSGFDPQLKLFAPDGELVTTASSGASVTNSDAEISALAEIGGSYTVVVDSRLAGGTGDYRLRYLRLPAAFGGVILVEAYVVE